jgi:hypothetical protein
MARLWVNRKVYAGDPQQGRRDSNPRPTVLETAALPTELRPCEWSKDCSREVFRPLNQRRALGALFALLAVGFLGIAFAAAYGARRELAGWAIALAALALAAWLGSMAFRAFR